MLPHLGCHLISSQVLDIQDHLMGFLEELLPHRFFHPLAPRCQLGPLLKDVVAGAHELQGEQENPGVSQTTHWPVMGAD